MTVRRPTLDEWFTDLQLRAIARSHAHLPLDLEIDVTALDAAYAARKVRAPWTALVVKAAATVAARHPEVNRAVLRTPLGMRIVQFDTVRVNLPVAVHDGGRRYLGATVLAGADALSIAAIEEAIAAAKARPLDERPLVRTLARGRGGALDRLALRARHFLAYSVPRVYEAHGGGITVSSLVREAPAGVKVRLPSYGPTAFTLCPGAIHRAHGRTLLAIGIGYDHAALSGKDAVRAADAIGSFLATPDPSIGAA